MSDEMSDAKAIPPEAKRRALALECVIVGQTTQRYCTCDEIDFTDWPDDLRAACGFCRVVDAVEAKLSALAASTPEGWQAALCDAFRAGWATGYQECAEGLVLQWVGETGERHSAETAALERWLFVRAASASREIPAPPATEPT